MATDDVTRALPADPEDRLILARRLVAERCLYGVDKNPLAVEMAKLSLWLVTLSRDRPFTFLDHALRFGDSLLGIDVEQLTTWSLTPNQAQTIPWFTFPVRQALERAQGLRRKLAVILEKDVHDAEVKQRLLAEATETMAVIELGADLLLATALADPKQAERLRNDLLARYHLALATLETVQAGRLKPDAQAESRAAIAALRAEADSLLAGQRPFHWLLEYPEVFDNGGFHAFVGNPPFIGGRRIRETLGDDYREALYQLYPGSSGNADYCAFFFLRAFAHLRPGGTLGLVATNTIAQGDTRLTGLDTIVARGGTIYNATNNQSWPGQAAVSVDVVHITNRRLRSPFVLDGKLVSHISGFLDTGTATGEPYRLAQNQGKSHMGTNVVGTGFVLVPDEAQALITRDPRNRAVLFPFLNGEDVNSSPTQSPSRWIINFFDWPLEQAETYPDCITIVRERVYPERKGNKGIYAKLWWQYGRRQERLYETVKPLPRAMVLALTSKHLSFSFTTSECVFSHACGVVASDSAGYFAVLQSSLHEVWARKLSSTLEMRLRYTPSEIFETFPFPQPPTPDPQPPDSLGETYHEHRRQIMLARQEGLTATYNRFHNPDELAADIVRLRELHVAMDQAVAAAYGWSDIELGHGFHQTAQGVRFTISETARREVLERLLALNHQRYAEEVAAGLHEKGKTKAKVKGEGNKFARTKGASTEKPAPTKPGGQPSLFK